MTIAQRFTEMATQMGLDMSNCHTGNIGEVINAMTLQANGNVSDSQNIQLAIRNFTSTILRPANGTATINPDDSWIPSGPNPGNTGFVS